MRRITAAAVLTASFLLAGNAYSDPILDQSQEDGTLPFDVSQLGDYDYAQTFTVGVSGRLTAIALRLGSWNLEFPRLDLFGSILPTLDGAPVADASLGLATFFDSTLLPYAELNDPPPFRLLLLDNPISVTAGDVLAIALLEGREDNGEVFSLIWAGNHATSYSRGALFVRSPDFPNWTSDEDLGGEGADFAFRTYVEPIPEPAPLVLVGTVMVAFGLRKRRTTRRFRGQSAPGVN